jgi:TPR repeat protein
LLETTLGWLYKNGLGIAKDYTEAMNWFRKAANQGYAEAQNNIGWLFQNGWGVNKIMATQ